MNLWVARVYDALAQFLHYELNRRTLLLNHKQSWGVEKELEGVNGLLDPFCVLVTGDRVSARFDDVDLAGRVDVMGMPDGVTLAARLIGQFGTSDMVAFYSGLSLIHI